MLPLEHASRCEIGTAAAGRGTNIIYLGTIGAKVAAPQLLIATAAWETDMNVEKMKVVDPFQVNEVVDKTNVASKLNSEMDVTTPTNFAGVTRDVIPVNLDRLCELRFTEVAPNTTVPAHAHQGPIFRLITDGEATVNGKTYKKGDWMVIPAHSKYEIKTTTGYTAAWNCITC